MFQCIGKNRQFLYHCIGIFDRFLFYCRGEMNSKHIVYSIFLRINKYMSNATIITYLCENKLRIYHLLL